MQLIRGLYNIKPHHRQGILTIGNFDGVHIGHQQILRTLVAQAKHLARPAGVIVFEPQPQEYFYPETCAPRLTRLRDKAQLLAELGLDFLLCLPFNAQLAALTAEQFIHHVLIEQLAVQQIFIGDDFQFGYQRLGNHSTLLEASQRQHFKLTSVDSVPLDHQRISSTLIRQALAIGDLTLAKKQLGRPYCIQGRVAHGDKKAYALLGTPTANIHLHRQAVPLLGVYVIKVHGLAHSALPGIANLGYRPTLSGKHCLLEVHLFDFAKDLYHQHLQVEFLYKIRAEQHFASLDLLKEQIQRDIVTAKTFLTETQV